MTPAELHETVLALPPRKALTVMFDQIDNWLLEEQWALVRTTLRTVPVEKLSITALLGYATITLIAKDMLGYARSEYIERMRAFLQEQDPERAERLMSGLT